VCVCLSRGTPKRDGDKGDRQTDRQADE